MARTLTPQDIKDIRKQYGLSQKSFALLLGIGPASIVRYEQGATPSKANANLIRAARNPEFMRDCLEEDGYLIPETQRVRAQTVVYDYISLDPEEDARMHEGLDATGLSPTMSMSEVYHFTLQQEILNEQAANLIGEILSLKLSAGISPDVQQYYDSLLRQLSLIKPTIISVEMFEDTKLAQIRGFLDCADAILHKSHAEVA